VGEEEAEWRIEKRDVSRDDPDPEGVEFEEVRYERWLNERDA
jgi:hypothetical protein